MLKRIAVVLLLLTTICIGCSQNVKVTGKVTFADDNSPLTCGTVVFDDGKVSGKALLSEDGTYKMGFEKDGNGIPPGEYSVYIMGAVKKEKSSKKPQKNAMQSQPVEGLGSFTYTQLIAKKYQSRQTSGLRATIDGSSQQLDFTVERP